MTAAPARAARRRAARTVASNRRQVTCNNASRGEVSPSPRELPPDFHGATMSDKPVILVLCTGNSARSQMAEGFLRKYKGDRFPAASAGTEPKSQVHPLAVRAMKKIGIDIGG